MSGKILVHMQCFLQLGTSPQVFFSKTGSMFAEERTLQQIFLDHLIELDELPLDLPFTKKQIRQFPLKAYFSTSIDYIVDGIPVGIRYALDIPLFVVRDLPWCKDGMFVTFIINPPKTALLQVTETAELLKPTAPRDTPNFEDEADLAMYAEALNVKAEEATATPGAEYIEVETNATPSIPDSVVADQGLDESGSEVEAERSGIPNRLVRVRELSHGSDLTDGVSVDEMDLSNSSGTGAGVGFYDPTPNKRVVNPINQSTPNYTPGYAKKSVIPIASRQSSDLLSTKQVLLDATLEKREKSPRSGQEEGAPKRKRGRPPKVKADTANLKLSGEGQGGKKAVTPKIVVIAAKRRLGSKDMSLASE